MQGVEGALSVVCRACLGATECTPIFVIEEICLDRRAGFG